MTERTTGIILRTRPFTETSLIANWLTNDVGRISTIAKGARRPKSSFRGMLDLFYLADFSFDRSRRSDLHTLREISLRETFAPLRQNMDSLRQASYCAALIQQTTETDTPLPEIFELLKGFLQHLAINPPRPRNILAFELKLLGLLGLGPDPDTSRVSAGTKEIVRSLTEDDWPALLQLNPTTAQARELQQFLRGFLIFHLGKIPGSRVAALKA
jgi:DNA repair protein RecO (recombination protein O)